MTTYPTSTAPAAKLWLFQQMQSTLTPASGWSLEVTYATMVDTNNSPADQVWMGGITGRAVANFAMVGNLGQYSLAEQYDIEINVSCFRPVDRDEDAETQAWDLCGQIETIARTDPTLGGNVMTSRPNTSTAAVDWSFDEEAANGRICTLQLTIHCEAVI
jgi:hypothetical protein